MKINRLETHDRLLEFRKQADYISKGCEDCIRNRPAEFENYPFYIFAHSREIAMDERIALYNQDIQSTLLDPRLQRKFLTIHDVPTARMIWVPRLSKPAAQENSMLFKAYPPGNNIRPIWMIPSRELWDQYKKDLMTENCLVSESIYNFINNRKFLECDEDDDLPEWRQKAIYKEIAINKEKAKPRFLQEF